MKGFNSKEKKYEHATDKGVYYNVPIRKVWQAITDKDKMKEWYFLNFKSLNL